MGKTYNKPPDDAAPPAGPIPLTPAGIERLHERLFRLKGLLPEYIAEAARTAAEGDRSDNDAYKQSKALLRRTHRQIFTIEDQLKRAVPITKGAHASETVQLGSTVVLELIDSKEKELSQKIFELVGPFETNPARGRISHESPLGAALIGHKKNETVIIKTPKGPQKYLILEIR